MESLNPIAVQELLAGYVLEDLTPAEQAQVEEMLSQNPALVQEVEQLRATLNLLPLGLSSADVPPPLLLSPSPVNQFSPSVIKSTPKFPWGKIALGGLLATAIAGLSWQNYRLHQQLATIEQTNQTLQQVLDSQGDQQQTQQLSTYRQVVNFLQEPNQNFLTLRATQATSQATGSLIVGAESASALLVLKDVPPTTDGKFYQLWAVIDGKKVPCRSFLPNAQGEVLLEIPFEKWFSASEVMVTEEKKGSLRQPRGEMVIQGQQMPFQS
ncbi:anti-sigma factor [Synechocystis sp. FACHB-383]|uniref:anti-sigma factor n=1 Tax=Synechocystis sp. FACHB-383 TaxID=2692864 RepID=UPI001686E301|nr:anti-sigma factor [Synechocystis sp. FACHB-383]MBD2654077.1 anti-sigma factor [Synechocystis sp. FACHB-383]